MSQPSYQQLRDVLVPVSLEAGRLILEIYKEDFQVMEKRDESPVTVADQRAEELILEALKKSWPDIPVVAEEQAAAGIIPLCGDLFFLVDPLDGTKEFISKRGEFTVNIALIDKGKPVFGLVLAPALGALYITLDQKHAGLAIVEFEPVVTAVADLEYSPIKTRPWPGATAAAVISRSHIDQQTQDFLDLNQVTERVSSGSSLKFCLLAAGKADIYPRFGPTMEWDTAAGHAVLDAAGGLVVCPDGAPFRYGKGNADYRNGGFVAMDQDSPKLIRLTD